MADNLLKYALREGTGKSVTRKLRKDGLIPAVVYERNGENQVITVEKDNFKGVLNSLRGKLLIAELSPPEGESFRAVIKAIQRHPITEEYLNIDFQKIHSGELIQVSVPIMVTGTPEGLKLGGLVDHVRYEVNVKGTVANLPLSFDIDISELNIGDAIRIGDLDIPEDVELIDPPQAVIVAVAKARRVAEVAVDGAEGEEGEAEGEEGEAGEGEEGAAKSES